MNQIIKYFTILLFFLGILKANHGDTYISPGIQIGMNSKGNLFVSGQITFGYITNNLGLPIGLTIGRRVYKIEKKEWEKYNYIDAQVWPTFGGMGLGIMIDENKNAYTRFKCGLGLFGYLTYDNFEIFENNYGIIGVFPILPRGISL